MLARAILNAIVARHRLYVRSCAREAGDAVSRYQKVRAAGLTAATVLALVAGTVPANSVGALEVARSGDQFSEFARATVESGVLAKVAAVGLTELDAGELESLWDLIEQSGGESLVIRKESMGLSSRLAVSPQSSLAASSAPKPPPCTANPSQVHLRKSGGYSVAGNKPFTECTVAQRHLYITTVLFTKRITGLLGSKSHGTYGGPTKGARNERRYENKAIEKACKNTKSTSWHALNEHVVIDNDGCPWAFITKTAVTKLNCGVV